MVKASNPLLDIIKAFAGPGDRMLPLVSLGSTPNKYQPHQGKREQARRMRQMQKLVAEARG